MADRFATFRETEKNRLRADIVASVDRELRLESSALDAAISIAEAAAEKAVAEWAGLDNFIASTFVGAGLAALAKNGSVNDLTIARHHLDSKSPASTEAALEMVSRLGNDTDVEPLLALAARE